MLDEVAHVREILVLQHTGLGERELVNRVIRDVVPVDEILDDVIVHSEWEHGGNRLHVQTLLFGKSLKLPDVVDVLSCIVFEPCAGSLVLEEFEIGGNYRH